MTHRISLRVGRANTILATHAMCCVCFSIHMRPQCAFSRSVDIASLIATNYYPRHRGSCSVPHALGKRATSSAIHKTERDAFGVRLLAKSSKN
jgi:hypothetical protein